jgi:hypothetical protein
MNTDEAKPLTGQIIFSRRQSLRRISIRRVRCDLIRAGSETGAPAAK